MTIHIRISSVESQDLFSWTKCIYTTAVLSHSKEPAGFNQEDAYSCIYVNIQFGQMGYLTTNFLNCNLISSYFFASKYRSRALKSRSKLRAAIRLRAAFGNFLLHKNSCLFTVTFGEKVLTLAKSRGS